VYKAATHVNNFYSYFRLHPVDDDAEDVVIKIFPTTLHGNAKRWYDDLPNASITSMNQLEEVFLKEWGIRLGDISILLKRIEHIKQAENETLFDFQSRLEGTLCQIPRSHCPEDKYIVYLYTHAILGHLGLPLSKRGPRTLDEAYDMAIGIERNIPLSGIKDLFTSGTLSMESLFSHENFVDDFQEEGEQTIIQQGIAEDMAEEMEPKKNEVSTYAPPSNEAIQESVSPTRQKDDEVSCFPFQDSDDTVFHDSENEGEMEALNKMNIPCCTIKDKEAVHEDEKITHAENTKVLETPAQKETVSCPPPQDFDASLLYDGGDKEEINVSLNFSKPTCYDTDSDIVDNIDEFICVGRRRWDIVGYDMDPIYDIESHFQVLPLELSQQISQCCL
jgi:hypothetical protein